MTFVAERNEIAGRTEQNVPTDRISSVSAASGSGDSSSSPKGGAKLSVDFSARDLPAENLPILDVSGKLAAPTPITTAPPVAAAAPTQHLEKLEQMISQEAVNIRQTGDNSIGVSLQIDGQTRLFLQLTQQNGQIQATLQCEKGSFSASDPQWAALQQSLAGQNVQLTAPASGSAQFGSTGENQQRSLPSRDDSTTSNGFGVPGARQRQPRNQNGSRQNWESWA